MEDAGGPPRPLDHLRTKSFVRFPSSHNIDGEHDYRHNCNKNNIKPEHQEQLPQESSIKDGGGKEEGNQNAVETSTQSPGTYRQEIMKKAPIPTRERPENAPWPQEESLSFTRSLIFYGAGSMTTEHEMGCKMIQEARAMRKKYHESQATHLENDTSLDDLKSLMEKKQLSFAFGTDGIVEITSPGEQAKSSLISVPTMDEFFKDYHRLVEICRHGAVRSFCFQRLQLLSSSFKMHETANSASESLEQSNLLGTDFYRTMKIDNHIHAAAAMSAKSFVEFVSNKLRTEPHVQVVPGETLQEIFERVPGLKQQHAAAPNGNMNGNHHVDVDDEKIMTAANLTIDAMNVLADYSVYQRFDNFNDKYSPFAMADMRRIFLKTKNHMGGRYFAELLRGVMRRHEVSKGHRSAVEMRLSIYGMERHEWRDLATWMLTDWENGTGPVISTHNRWLIQVPRLWRIYKSKHSSQSFQGMLDNLFIPLFEATLYPEEHSEIATLLTHIVGFDSVDDEGAHESARCATQRPHEWDSTENPAYWWQLYYLWANLEVLNTLRRARGLNTFDFRPHAGETGDVMHLAATYMLCRSINHGIALHNQVSLQYLYYLDQVGLSISPLSNNFLFRKIATNPFPKLFRRGLNVTLSTDDPLLFHMTDDALLEEYSVARASFDLSMVDVSEIARNSVLQSGFQDELKRKWLGENYAKGVTFCDETLTHVPLIRAKYRAEHLAIEHMLIHLIAAGKRDDILNEMMVQFNLARDAHRKILFDSVNDATTTTTDFPYQQQL